MEKPPSCAVIDPPLAAEQRPAQVALPKRRRAWSAIAGRALGLVATFLLNAVMARLLLPADYGEFQLLLTVLLPASWIAVAGVHSAAVRVLGETQATEGLPAAADVARHLLRTAALCTTMSMPVLGLLLLVGAQGGLPLPNDMAVLGVFCLAVVLIALQQLVAEVFNGLHELRIAALFTGGMIGGPVATLLFMSILMIAALLRSSGDGPHFPLRDVNLALHSPTLLEATAALALALGITLAVSWSWLQRTLQNIGTAAPRTFSLSPLLHLALSLLGLQLTVYLATLADVWIAGQYFRDAGGKALPQLDWYIAARRLTLLGLVPLQLAGALVGPATATLYFAGRQQELQAILRRYATWGSLPCLLLCGLLLLEPRWLLAVYLGPRFVEAASVVRILALGIAIAALSGHAGYALAVTGHQRVAFAANALAGLVVVVGGVPAAQYGGPEGLAAAALLAILVKYVGEWWLVRRLLGISTHVG